MHITLTVAVSATLFAVSNACARIDQACLSKAAGALPHITGLAVKGSRTRPVPAAVLATWKGQARPIIVDIDVVTEGEQETYSYLCVMTQGSAFVQRTMN